MNITRRSNLDGKEYTLDVDITPEEYQAYKDNLLLGPNRKHIQHVLPNLNKEHREFLISGITPIEWNKIFGEERS